MPASSNSDNGGEGTWDSAQDASVTARSESEEEVTEGNGEEDESNNDAMEYEATTEDSGDNEFFESLEDIEAELRSE